MHYATVHWLAVATGLTRTGVVAIHSHDVAIGLAQYKRQFLSEILGSFQNLESWTLLLWTCLALACVLQENGTCWERTRKGFGLRTFWKHTPSQSDAEVTMIIQEPSLGQECTVEELELAQSPNLCKDAQLITIYFGAHSCRLKSWWPVSRWIGQSVPSIALSKHCQNDFELNNGRYYQHGLIKRASLVTAGFYTNLYNLAWHGAHGPKLLNVTVRSMRNPPLTISESGSTDAGVFGVYVQISSSSDWLTLKGWDFCIWVTWLFF